MYSITKHPAPPSIDIDIDIDIDSVSTTDRFLEVGALRALRSRLFLSDLGSSSRGSWLDDALQISLQLPRSKQ